MLAMRADSQQTGESHRPDALGGPPSGAPLALWPRYVTECRQAVPYIHAHVSVVRRNNGAVVL